MTKRQHLHIADDLVLVARKTGVDSCGHFVAWKVMCDGREHDASITFGGKIGKKQMTYAACYAAAQLIRKINRGIFGDDARWFEASIPMSAKVKQMTIVAEKLLS